MPRGVARVGDRTIGTCAHPSHLVPITVGGTIVTGSPDVITNDRLTARVGDLVLTDCGHYGEIITGSPNDYANDKLIARIEDKVANRAPYTATIITASTDTYAQE
jgi:uncharacterized Zn-binding protein involved in type VI secretion